jgi:hypothetical protein
VKRAALALWICLTLSPAGAQLSVISGPTPSISSVPNVAVAGLPVCNAGTDGLIYRVTNALTPIIGSVVIGGGAITLLVHCASGTGWVVA